MSHEIAGDVEFAFTVNLDASDDFDFMAALIKTPVVSELITKASMLPSADGRTSLEMRFAGPASLVATAMVNLDCILQDLHPGR